MDQRTYRNFDLVVEHTERGYRARVQDPPEGQTPWVRFALPFTDAERAAATAAIWSTDGARAYRLAGEQPTDLDPQQFGQRLFDALFQGPLLIGLNRTLAQVEQAGEGLRLRLHLGDAPELAALPWEYLHGPPPYGFFALSQQTPLVRYLELQQTQRPLTVEPPLHILTVISDPIDLEPRLKVEHEWQRLHQELGKLQAEGILTLERLPSATVDALQSRLSRPPAVHILHFIGHGRYDPTTRTGGLILEDGEHRSHLVDAAALGALLYDHTSLRLVFLNACEGGRSDETDPFTGLAQQLVQRRLPAVIAMQYKVSDNAAIRLSATFYRALADGQPVDAALAQARQALYAQRQRLEWGTPVLFLRAPDGMLWRRKKLNDAEIGEDKARRDNTGDEVIPVGSAKSSAGDLPIDGKAASGDNLPGDKIGGDAIIGNVHNSTYTVIGKNIIQIGRLEVPLFLALILATGIAIVVLVTIYRFYQEGLWRTYDQGQPAQSLTIGPAPTPTATTPPVMPGGAYNIAVAELIALDLAGQVISTRETSDRANGIVEFLNSEASFIEQIRLATGQKPTIWGPSQRIPVITAETADIQSRSLNADIIIYGILRQVSTTSWSLEPAFFIASDLLSVEESLLGEYALIAPIVYSPTDRASIRELTFRLETLLRKLALLIIGTSYYKNATLEDYCRAAILFQQAVGSGTRMHNGAITGCPQMSDPLVRTTDWTRSSERQVIDALPYLFLGNAYLQLAFIQKRYHEDRTSAAQLLDRAYDTYLAGRDLAPSLARFYSGLGQVDYQLARLHERRNVWIDSGCEHIDFVKLESSVGFFTETLKRTNSEAQKIEAPNANQYVTMIAHLGLGRGYEVTYRCKVATSVESFELSQQSYLTIIEKYKEQPVPYLLKITIYAHAELGSLLLWRSRELSEQSEDVTDLQERAELHLQEAYSMAKHSRSTILIQDIEQNTIVCSVLDCEDE